MKTRLASGEKNGRKRMAVLGGDKLGAHTRTEAADIARKRDLTDRCAPA
jgi:hypothetical protein